jgi:hypothetical protein
MGAATLERSNRDSRHSMEKGLLDSWHETRDRRVLDFEGWDFPDGIQDSGSDWFVSL